MGRELIDASKQVMEHHWLSEQGSAVCWRCVKLVAVGGEERVSV